MRQKKTNFIRIKKIIIFILIFSMAVPIGFSIPTPAFAANTKIRQEVNITDAHYYAAANTYATSSEIVAITDNNYTSPTYYFEVVASTTAATTASVSLVNATSSAIVKTISITGGNTYQRYRSTSFLPNASTTVEYKVVLNNENVGKGIIASRIVVLQDASTLSKTETQIEVGNNETYTSTATSTFASPKYWYYDSTKWDGSPTFYAEVTYTNTSSPTTASSTTYSTAGTFTVVIPSGVASTSIQLWGGGGSGGGVNATDCTGSGGAGGQYAKSRIADLGGTSKQLFIGAAVTGTSAANGSIGATTTWDGGVVKAGGGYFGKVDAGGGGVGSTEGGVGDVVYAGGNGGVGACAEGYSGGGGEGAGSTGTGGSATGTSGVTGGTGTDGGDGADGLTSTVGTGNTGSSPGGGGSGGRTTNTSNRIGGTGGLGQAIITNDIPINATTTISLEMSDGSGDGFVNWTPVAQIVKQSDYTVSTSTRIRSVAFTPTHGRNYRIAFSEGYNGATHAIYNAKIVVVQNSSGGVDSYYFNVSDAGPTDPNSKWTNDANAFDGNTATFSSQSPQTTGDTSTNYLQGDGTTAPTSGNTISQVRARMYAGCTGSVCSGVTGNAEIYTDGLAEDLGTVIATIGSPDTYQWSNYTTLSTPSGGWTFQKVNDLEVKLYGSTGVAQVLEIAKIEVEVTSGSSSITLLQPQYLLANTKFANNTSLQKFLNYWNPSEWSTTNAYVFQAETANGDSSVVGLNAAEGTQISGSFLSSPDNRATSTALCMPYVGDLDTQATTNSGFVFASRILVDVGGTPSTCGVSPGTRKLILRIARLLNVRLR